MAFDEVKALQTIEKLDAAGDGELIEALAAADDPDLEARLAKGKWTPEQLKRLKAAMRVMGPELAKEFKFPTSDDSGEGDPEEMDEEEKVKAKKAADDAAALAKAELPADVVERLAKADAQEVRLQKAEADLAKMQHEKEREVYIRKAAEIADTLPGATADDLGGILLKTAKALSPAEQAKLEGVLAGANTLLKKGVAFAEFGSALGGEGGDDPMAVVRAKADDLRKSDPKLTPEQARARVLKENPALMTAINKAQDDRVRKARS